MAIFLSLLYVRARRSNQSLSNSQTPTADHVRELSFVCDGVRLEMRPLRWSCQTPYGENASDTLGTTTYSEPPDHLPNDVSKIGAATDKNVSVLRDESGGSTAGGARGSGSSGSPLGEYKHHRGTGLAHLDHDCPATSTGGRCHQRRTPVVFTQDLTHSEVDALLGKKLVWQNPFEV